MEMGGAEQVIRQIIENSDLDNFQPSVLCLDSKVGVIGQELKKLGFDTFCFERKSGLDRALIKKLKHYLRNEKIDVVHCHQYTPYVYGLLAAIGSNTKVLFTEHGRFYPDSYKWKRYLINPVLNFFTDKIVSISKATVDAMVKFENFPRRNIEVIYNGIKSGEEVLSEKLESALKAELGIAKEDIVFGTISRLDPIKNQKMMITAFRRVSEGLTNAKLVLIGDGPSREELEEHVSRCDLDGKVIFTGFIVNPQRYFCLMDIFLLPSLSEGTSMTLLEAMAFSIPCIVTDVGGNPEIVIENETGIVVPNDDSSRLAEAMITLSKNKALCAKYGERGRLRYQENFTVKHMVDAYENLYLKLSQK